MKVLTAKDLSQNLTVEEFIRSEKAKTLKIDNRMNAQQLERAKEWAGAIFQPMRTHFGLPIFLSSGFRSPKLNTAVNNGRITNSQHQAGEAGDLDNDDLIAKKVKCPTNAELFHFIRQNLPFDQLIWEFGDRAQPGWVHVSYSCDGKGRRQILVASADAKGKTIYSPWSA